MITFRFYLVTLVAVFLAIALGVVVGSTFFEPAVVENLQSQVDAVQRNLDQRLEAIDSLNREIEDLASYLDASADHAVSGSLATTSVVVVAEEGLEGEIVERTVGRLRQGGAEVQGIVWIQQRLTAESPADRIALEGFLLSLGVVPAEGAEHTATRDLAWQELVATFVPSEPSAGDDGPSTTTTTVTGPTSAETSTTSGETPPPASAETSTTAPPQAPTTIAPTPPGPWFDTPALTALADAGFVRLQRIERAAPAEPPDPSVATARAIVLITGRDSDLGDGGALLTGLARAQVAAGVATLLAEIGDTGNRDAGPGNVQLVREDPELSAAVSTVDDLDLVQGVVATVLATADLEHRVVGHYGYGAGADRVLPAWLER